jgi:hypothetical protein
MTRSAISLFDLALAGGLFFAGTTAAYCGHHPKVGPRKSLKQRGDNRSESGLTIAE